jgi:hypothetical protein
MTKIFYLIFRTNKLELLGKRIRAEFARNDRNDRNNRDRDRDNRDDRRRDDDRGSRGLTDRYYILLIKE